MKNLNNLISKNSQNQSSTGLNHNPTPSTTQSPLPQNRSSNQATSRVHTSIVPQLIATTTTERSTPNQLQQSLTIRPPALHPTAANAILQLIKTIDEESPYAKDRTWATALPPDQMITVLKALLHNPNKDRLFRLFFESLGNTLFKHQSLLGQLIEHLCTFSDINRGVFGCKEEYSLILAPTRTAKIHFVDDGSLIGSIVDRYIQRIKQQSTQFADFCSLEGVLDAFEQHCSLALICKLPTKSGKTVVEILNSLLVDKGISEEVKDRLKQRLMRYEDWIASTPNWHYFLPLYSENIEVVKEALSRPFYKSRINIKSADGISPIVWALLNKRPQIVYSLFENGATIRSQSALESSNIFHDMLRAICTLKGVASHYKDTPITTPTRALRVIHKVLTLYIHQRSPEKTLYITNNLAREEIERLINEPDHTSQSPRYIYKNLFKDDLPVTQITSESNQSEYDLLDLELLFDQNPTPGKKKLSLPSDFAWITLEDLHSGNRTSYFDLPVLLNQELACLQEAASNPSEALFFTLFEYCLPMLNLEDYTHLIKTLIRKEKSNLLNRMLESVARQSWLNYAELSRRHIPHTLISFANTTCAGELPDEKVRKLTKACLTSSTLFICARVKGLLRGQSVVDILKAGDCKNQSDSISALGSNPFATDEDVAKKIEFFIWSLDIQALEKVLLENQEFSFRDLFKVHPHFLVSALALESPEIANLCLQNGAALDGVLKHFCDLFSPLHQKGLAPDLIYLKALFILSFVYTHILKDGGSDETFLDAITGKQGQEPSILRHIYLAHCYNFVARFLADSNAKTRYPELHSFFKGYQNDWRICNATENPNITTTQTIGSTRGIEPITATVEPIEAHLQLLQKPVSQIVQDLPVIQEKFEITIGNFAAHQKEKALQIHQDLYAALKTFLTPENYLTIAKNNLEENQGVWALTLNLMDGSHAPEMQLLKSLFPVYQQYVDNHRADPDEIQIIDATVWSFLHALHFYLNPTQQSYTEEELRTAIGFSKYPSNIAIRYLKIVEKSLHSDPAESVEPTTLVPRETDLLYGVRDALLYLKLHELENGENILKAETAHAATIMPCFVVLDQKTSYKAHMMQLAFDRRGCIKSLLLDTTGICRNHLPETVLIDPVGNSATFDINSLTMLRNALQGEKAPFYLIEPALLQKSLKAAESQGKKRSQPQSTGKESRQPAASSKANPLDFKELVAIITKAPKKAKLQTQEKTIAPRRGGSTTTTIEYPHTSEPTEESTSSPEKTADMPGIGAIPAKTSFGSIQEMLQYLSQQHLTGSLSNLQRRIGNGSGINTPLVYPLLHRLVPKSEQELQVEANNMHACFPGIKPYQETALKVLRLLNKAGINGMLSLDMGLGKTLVMAELIISQFVQQRQAGDNKPTLVVAPSSILIQTKRKFEDYLHTAEIKPLQRLVADVPHMSAKQQEKFWAIVSMHLRRKESPEITNAVRALLEQCTIVEAPTRTRMLSAIKHHCTFFIELLLHPALKEQLAAITTNAPPFEAMWQFYLEALKLDVKDERHVQLVRLITQYLSLSSTPLRQTTIPNSTTTEIDQLLDHPLFEMNSAGCITILEKKEKLLKFVNKTIEDQRPQIIITTPDAVVGAKNTNPTFLDKLHVESLLVDEAHILRKADSEVTKCISPLASKIAARSRPITLVTGTPFEKDLSDICTLLSIANPESGLDKEIFKSLRKKIKAAAAVFGNLLRQQGEVTDQQQAESVIANAFAHMEVFKSIITTLIVRARKVDTKIITQWEGAIPQKQYCPMAYTLTQEQEAKVTQLREQGENRQFLKQWAQTTNILFHPEIDSSRADIDRYIARSGVLSALFNSVALEELLEKKQSFLVFVDQIKHGDVLCQLLQQKYGRNINVDFLYGDVKLEERDKMVKKVLEQKSHAHCLILTIGVGGVGLDIPGKDIFMLAKPWNPSERLQAEDRSIRVGHRGDVRIYTFLNETIDERYKFLYEMKERWEEYLFSGDEHSLEARFTSFTRLLGGLYQEDTEAMIGLLDAQIVIDQLSCSAIVPRLQQFIDQVTPQALPALLRIKKVALTHEITRAPVPATVFLQEPQGATSFDLIGEGVDLSAALQLGSADAMARVQQSSMIKYITGVRQKCGSDHKKLLDILRGIPSSNTVEGCVAKGCSVEIYKALQGKLELLYKQEPAAKKATIRLLRDGERYHLLLRTLAPSVSAVAAVLAKQ